LPAFRQGLFTVYPPRIGTFPVKKGFPGTSRPTAFSGICQGGGYRTGGGSGAATRSQNGTGRKSKAKSPKTKAERLFGMFMKL